MDDPFIRNYVEDLLRKIRTQVRWQEAAGARMHLHALGRTSVEKDGRGDRAERALPCVACTHACRGAGVWLLALPWWLCAARLCRPR
jgi:hypothetical protein